MIQEDLGDKKLVETFHQNEHRDISSSKILGSTGKLCEASCLVRGSFLQTFLKQLKQSRTNYIKSSSQSLYFIKVT